jgi:hypothetical protein
MGIHSTQGLSLFAWTTAVLRVNNKVNKTLRITVQLKILSEAASFIADSGILGIWWKF